MRTLCNGRRAFRFSAFPQFLIFGALPGLLAAQTSVSLTVSPDPSVFGAPVTLTAAVTPASTTGRVTFFDGATMLGTRSLFFGAASISTTLLPAGIRRLTALYNGGANHVSSTSNVVSQRVKAVAEDGFLIQLPLSILPIQDGGVVVADFNGDGIPDLAVRGLGLYILLGNGDGTFRQGASYPMLGFVTVGILMVTASGPRGGNRCLDRQMAMGHSVRLSRPTQGRWEFPWWAISMETGKRTFCSRAWGDALLL